MVPLSQSTRCWWRIEVVFVSSLSSTNGKIDIAYANVARPALLGEPFGHPFCMYGNGCCSMEERGARSCACSKKSPFDSYVSGSRSVGGIATKGKSKIRGQRRPFPWSMPTHLLLGSCEDAMTALRTLALEVKCVGILPDFSGGTWDSMVLSSVPMSFRRFHNFSRCLFREPPRGLNGGVFLLRARWQPYGPQRRRPGGARHVGRLYGKLKMPDRYVDAKEVRARW